ncbi:MAG: tetratricopeptide repeat protein [Candidatus Hydrogenedentes bacterium]|nr:tetratricopeptide repeat protein [Candidatus Hydrogenedentota bacterium]
MSNKIRLFTSITASILFFCYFLEGDLSAHQISSDDCCWHPKETPNPDFIECDKSFIKSLLENFERECVYKERVCEAEQMNKLGILYYEQGNYNEAEKIFKKCLLLLKRFCPEENKAIVKVTRNLAKTYEAQNQLEKAVSLYEDGLKLLSISKNGNENLIIDLKIDLAKLYAEQGKYANAEDLLKPILSSFEKDLSRKNTYLFTVVLENLAEIYEKQNRLCEAESLYQKSLEYRLGILGNEQLETAFTLSKIAGLYIKMNEHEKAEKTCREALEIAEKHINENDPSIGFLIDNLALIYLETNNLCEAEKLCKKANEILKKFYGEKHPEILTNLNNLASIYAKQGRYSEAEELYEEVLENLKKLYGSQHPKVKATLSNMTSLYEKMDKDKVMKKGKKIKCFGKVILPSQF